LSNASDDPETVSSQQATARLAEVLDKLDWMELREKFLEQDQFIDLDPLLGPTDVAPLSRLAEALSPLANRSYVPGFKRGKSIARGILEADGQVFDALYRSPDLREFLQTLVGEGLEICPDWDAHGVAIYFYTREGDHIGWHYDTSLYRGKRFTLLLGLVDDSSCRLECELNRRSAGKVEAHSVALRPGRVVFFNGDTIYHRVTPLQEGERRICLTMEFVTDPRMSWPSRIVSGIKDRFAYFGFGRKDGNQVPTAKLPASDQTPSSR
jgi:2OG-Fe(II) oxygenase superfamily